MPLTPIGSILVADPPAPPFLYQNYTSSPSLKAISAFSREVGLLDPVDRLIYVLAIRNSPSTSVSLVVGLNCLNYRI
ncbi:MAG: hypothetical protein CM15mV113_020 [Caudoviricetes sp.]|nr:MAG: hypothetical protein CM15mV113_020 [Caudoviricetes sp.]